MKKIKVIIGAAFGDEGKGLMSDYFCSQKTTLEDALNIRFCGGSQAGHTVVTPDGLRHVFHHFGAGSFNNNVATYLGKDFIVNPIMFWKEHDELVRMGIKPKVYLHPQCKITLPFDMMVNQMIERHREDKRHGSCGLGINETLVRNKTLSVENTVSNTLINTYLHDFMNTVRAEYSTERLKELGVSHISLQDMELLNNKNIQKNYIRQFNDMLDYCEIVGDEILDKYNHLIFEGSQGLLLDQTNKAFFPHLTPANTGIDNVLLMLYRLGANWDVLNDVEICYVTRTYFTRHGAGEFPTECDKSQIADDLIDLTNHYNEFQGDFRYGYFNKELFIKAIRKDMGKIKGRKVEYSLAVTHMDKTGNKIVDGSKDGLSVEDLLSDLPTFNKVYASSGMSRQTVGEIMYGI